MDTLAYSKPFTPGAELGQYRIEGPIGEGGMGVVFRGLDTKLNRPVAIKVLSDELADVESALTWIAQNKESKSSEPAA